jgi:type II secretion system protein G
MKKLHPFSSLSVFRFESPAAPSPALRPLSAFQRNDRVNASAFTLVELLVVISIIIILMGLLFPAFKGVQDQARKTQAKNDLTQIVTALNAYNTDYGVYPLDNSKQGFDTLLGNPGGTYDNSLIFDVLRALPNGWNSNNVLNTRQVVYMQGSPVKDPANPKSGFATASATSSNGSAIKIGSFVDPWGGEYLVSVDSDYDGWTQDFIPYNDVTYTQKNGGAGMWSAISVGSFAASWGKDGKQGTNGDRNLKGSDDVVSWQ